MTFATPRKLTVKDALCQSIDSVCLVCFSDVSRAQAKRGRRCINSNAVGADETRFLLSAVDEDLNDLFSSFSSKPIHICSSCHNGFSRLHTAVKKKNDLELTIEKETNILSLRLKKNLWHGRDVGPLLGLVSIQQRLHQLNLRRLTLHP